MDYFLDIVKWLRKVTQERRSQIPVILEFTQKLIKDETSVGRNAEHLEPSYLAGGNENDRVSLDEFVSLL